ncbi:hypothetical protein C2G38_2198286 [Gigaspora rosea]|uniref:Uncharacterized protein n=1 Tax=Gigaspora rosea TaxID=44941 RepID=A0A397V1T4_9GLOM|nr:hypothetical protein C2G38_2198286 [Gigaspora rosea]
MTNNRLERRVLVGVSWTYSQKKNKKLNNTTPTTSTTVQLWRLQQNAIQLLIALKKKKAATPTTPTQQLQQGQILTVDCSKKKKADRYIRKALTRNERNKVKTKTPNPRQRGTRVIKPTTGYTDYSDSNSKHGTKSGEILTGDSLITVIQKKKLANVI